MSAIKLLVCVGPRCDAQGRGSALLDALRSATAEKFPAALAESRLAIQTRDCLRLCTRDPVVRLEPSGDAFSNPEVDALVSVLAEALSSSAA